MRPRYDGNACRNGFLYLRHYRLRQPATGKGDPNNGIFRTSLRLCDKVPDSRIYRNIPLNLVQQMARILARRSAVYYANNGVSRAGSYQPMSRLGIGAREDAGREYDCIVFHNEIFPAR